jgi:hypothetical protein
VDQHVAGAKANAEAQIAGVQEQAKQAKTKKRGK